MHDDRVSEAMRAVPRVRFLPRAQRAHADEDRALPLWHGSTGSQPSTVAAMLRLLDVPPGAAVLDVGAGSGWTTAILARLVGPEGEVLGLELDPELAAWGAANLARSLLEDGPTSDGERAASPRARLEVAQPGTVGRDRPGGWDRILVSAAARELPGALVGMLADPGRLVLPIRSTMHLVVVAEGQVSDSTHGSYAFVPLR
ncbi:protein-L-isoaspartate O-methyltransferase family protein [Cellulomonas persica]|uniref:Protein-L-isoaspartate O-methyltransferase n=1 Tax=Cellulomonas persica TaxID=76861 RepID=A0A510UUV0_9CELL|nr:protein-L-isoaspartate carboxylmethyltransferase [Cellulomonas persica]GEK18457.1 fibrillarin-like rRNA methylase [Cellulomonas persica]